MAAEVFVTHLNSDRQEAMRQGRGVRTKLVDGGVGASQVDLHLNRIAPGDAGGWYHAHPDAENVYVVLRGRVRVLTEGGPVVGEPGTVIFVPVGCPHATQNVGDETLEILEIYAPAGATSTAVEVDGPDG